MARSDPSTFARLVHTHHAAVYRSALRILRQAGDAEDVAQDVFVRVLQGKVELASAEEPRAVLCWLATQLSLNVLRGNRRRHHQETRAVIPEPDQSPAQEAADTETRATVGRLLAQLPEELRLPLELRYQDGLTFRAVGSALAIAESTAHDRVQQALAWLRARLERLGLCAVALPELIQSEQPPPLPIGLESRLLALPQAVAAGVPAVAKAACLAVLLVGLGAASFVLGNPAAQPPPGAPVAAVAGAALPDRDELAAGQPPARTEVTAQDPTPRPKPPLPRPPLPPAPAGGAPVVFQGTVHDADAWPVRGATVQAVAAGNLKPFELAATTTDGTGAFRLEVSKDGGAVPASRIRLRVLEQGLLLLQTEEFVVAQGSPPEPLRLTLPASAGVVTSRFTLRVTVRGADKAPLANVPLELYAQSDPPPRPGQGGAEVSGKTAADGTAALEGRQPGDKVLFVDGRPLGLRAEATTVAIARPGEHACAVELRPGLLLHGTLRGVDGTELDWANLWLEDEASRIAHITKLGAGGAFRFECLGDGPYTLRADRHPFSPAVLRGLRPGPQPLELRLKRRDDLRDVGHHMAELHGRLVDAATGATVPHQGEMLQVLPVRPGDSTLALDRVEPPRPVQRMVDRTEREAFHAVGLGAGTWAVIARVPGHGRAVELVPLREDELRTGLELRLSPGATVRGRVLDAAGQPLAKAHVFVVGFGARADQNLAGWDALAQQPGDRGAAPSVLACSVRAGPDGAFELTGMPTDAALRVVAVALGHSPAQTERLSLRAGEVRTDVVLHAVAR